VSHRPPRITVRRADAAVPPGFLVGRFTRGRSKGPAQLLGTQQLAAMGLVTKQQIAGAASGSTSFSLTADETITAPALVNVKSTFHIQNADGTTAGKDAMGVALETIANGAAGLVYFPGILASGFSGLSGGWAYPAAAGGVTSTPETASGQTAQRVGVAVSATQLIFSPQVSIQL
jgi:hypothetical protein